METNIRKKKSKLFQNTKWEPKHIKHIKLLWSKGLTAADIAKELTVFGLNVRNYRESYEIHASSGILFNHESPRRGETFVTRKITRGLSRIDAGLEECLYMGNLDSLRDWGHARDYVEMQWRMLQQEMPEDFVIATGRQESVRRFIELSAAALGWGGIDWEGSELNEIGRRKDTDAIVVRIDPRYFRPAEVETLLGDPTKAHSKLGWTPTTTLEELVKEMIENDREEARKEAYLRREGFNVIGTAQE